MTNHFRNMLYLFAQNARGIKANTEGELNIEEIRRLSIEQGIWTLVYPELAKLCDASKYQMEFFAQVSKGIAQKEFNLNTIKKLEEKGIKCCLLKGASVSCLYSDPECRISSDTDILLDPKDEKKLVNALIDMGYNVEKRAPTEHHVNAFHSQGGPFEAHVMLCRKVSEKIIFNGIQMYEEPWGTMDINGYKHHILGVNDGLMYLTAHYIKHLINEGGGVRQMMDLLLYIEAYKSQINFEKYNRILKELNYDKLLDVIKTVGAKYFGFDYEIKYEELAEKLLEDSEAGGIFGASTDTRRNFYSAYCDERNSMSKYKYKFFIMFNSKNSILNKIFPSSRNLVTVYGYDYAKNKWLVPVAWMNRWFDVIFRRVRKKPAEERAVSSELDSRMQMMRDLGMIN